MTWFESDYTQVADIYLEVLDSCHGNALVAADYSFDLRKRVTLLQSSISNKCLVYKITAYAVPSGQTRRVYVADYYHSGNPADH